MTNKNILRERVYIRNIQHVTLGVLEKSPSVWKERVKPVNHILQVAGLVDCTLILFNKYSITIIIINILFKNHAFS